MARSIVVHLLADSSQLERTFKRSAKSARQFEVSMTGVGRSMAQLGGAFGVGLGAAQLAEGIAASVNAASNLNEQISKSSIVFGDSAAAIRRWSEDTATSIGVAQDEALAAAGTFGNLFVTMGIGQKVSADMSRTLVNLAADLAAFNNTSPTEALDALRSGLVGEAEPLRRYGVRLSEARVQQVAMAETGKRNAKALTEQEKAAARYQIILDDTTTAQGNFNETQEGFAQQVKILQANMRDLSATAGNVLVPVLTDVVAELNDGVSAGGKFADVVRDIGKAARDAAEEIPGGDEGGGLAGRILGTAADVAGAQAKNRLIGIFLPGAHQLRLLLDGSLYAIGLIQDEAAKPLNFDFSAVNQLTQGLMTAGLAAKDLIEERGRGKAPPPFIPTAEQRRTWFDATISDMLDRIQDIESLKGKVAGLRAIQTKIEDAIARTTDPTRLRNLRRDLRAVLREIGGIQDDIAAQARQTQEAQEQARRERIETQFGWLEFAAERAEATKTVRDDLKAWRAIEAFLEQRIRQEGRTLELVRELWRARQRIRDLNARETDKDPLAGLVQVSSARLASMLAAGTGLGTYGRKVLGANIAGAQIQPVYVNVSLDGRQVARSVTTQQARGSRRTAKQTSGLRA